MKRIILALAAVAVLGGSSMAFVQKTDAVTEPAAAYGSCDPATCVPCSPEDCALSGCDVSNGGPSAGS